jgi:hypothetical protein
MEAAAEPPSPTAPFPLTVLSELGRGSNAVVLEVVRAAASSTADSPFSSCPAGVPLALKVGSHFWDEEAKALLECEERALWRPLRLVGCEVG